MTFASRKLSGSTASYATRRSATSPGVSGEVAATLTAAIMRENGENARHNDARETAFRLQNDLARRIDSIRDLLDSIASHILET